MLINFLIEKNKEDLQLFLDIIDAESRTKGWNWTAKRQAMVISPNNDYAQIKHLNRQNKLKERDQFKYLDISE